VWREATTSEELVGRSSRLAPPSESAEERRSVGSRLIGGKAESTVAGTLNKGSGESRNLGAPVDGRRLGPGKSRSLTRAWRKRSYQHDRVRPSGATTSWCDGRRQTPVVSFARGRQRHGEEVNSSRVTHSGSPFGELAEQQTTRGSWGRAVKRDPPGVWPSRNACCKARGFIRRSGVDAARTSVRRPVGHRAATPT
jgi:hypothetical protein